METGAISSVRVHYNRPQLLSRAIDAKYEVDIWGRGTGKSEGRLSLRALDMAQQMPRCSFVNVANTYMQLLDRTLPPMLKHWQELGMKRNVDFWVRRYPDKKFGLQMPYVMPETPDHCVFIRANKTQCSVMRLVSQDRPASSSGLSIDGILGDEARYLNYQKLQDELFPTNRGNERYFKYSHLHHGTCYTTDMPNTPGAKWLLEQEKQMDKEAVVLVKQLLYWVGKIEGAARARGRYLKTEEAMLRQLRGELFTLRKDLLFYSEASTLENIEILGEDFIRSMRRQLSAAEFNRAILNIRPNSVVNGFYPLLDDRHFYEAFEYDNYINNLPEKSFGKNKLNDCRKDSDIQLNKPLCVAPDFGGSFNCLSVGQREFTNFNFLKNFFVKNPQVVGNLVTDFDRYYRYFHKKEVIFYYDHTHYQKNPVGKNPKDELIDGLTKLGWSVRPRFVGETPSFFTRHQIWNKGFMGFDPKYLKPRFNKYNCEELRSSMQAVSIKPGASDPYAKDKWMEGRKELDQIEAPHLSDSADILYYGANLDFINDMGQPLDAWMLGK